MSEQNQTTPASPARKRLITGRRLAIAGAAALGLTALGAGAVLSQPGGWGHGPGWGHGQRHGWGMGPQGEHGGQGGGHGRGMGRDGEQRGQGYGHGRGMGERGMGEHGGRGMMGRGGMFGFGPERMIERALDSVEATPEQRQKIREIARGAFNDLVPLRDRREAARRQLATLLKADALDRAAIERLRVEQLQAFDASSKRAMQAMADAAEALTPDQRRKLVERWEWRRAWRRG